MNGWTENNNFNEYRIRDSSFNSSIQNNSSEDNSRQDNLSQENSSLKGFKPRSDIKLHLDTTSFESTNHDFESIDQDSMSTEEDMTHASADLEKNLESTSLETTDHYFVSKDKDSVSTDEDMAHTSTDESTAEAFIDIMYARHILNRPAQRKSHLKKALPK